MNIDNFLDGNSFWEFDIENKCYFCHSCHQVIGIDSKLYFEKQCPNCKKPMLEENIVSAMNRIVARLNKQRKAAYIGTQQSLF